MPPEQPNVPSPGRAVYTAVCTVQCSAVQYRWYRYLDVISCSGCPGGNQLLRWLYVVQCIVHCTVQTAVYMALPGDGTFGCSGGIHFPRWHTF